MLRRHFLQSLGGLVAALGLGAAKAADPGPNVWVQWDSYAKRRSKDSYDVWFDWYEYKASHKRRIQIGDWCILPEPHPTAGKWDGEYFRSDMYEWDNILVRGVEGKTYVLVNREAAK
jgi:hypothetical protein